MIVIERLTAEHILSVAGRLQEAQLKAVEPVTPEYASRVAGMHGVGWTVVGDGVPLACGGIVEAWPGRGLSWALFSRDALRQFWHVHRLVKGVLADSALPWSRVEMDVDASHAAGRRWAESLGFTLEGVRRKFTPDGRDMMLYARVK